MENNVQSKGSLAQNFAPLVIVGAIIVSILLFVFFENQNESISIISKKGFNCLHLYLGFSGIWRRRVNQYRG